MKDRLFEQGLLLTLLSVQLGWIGLIGWGAARVAGLL